MNDALYTQYILNLSAHPHNKAEMCDPDIRVPAKNPSCGDSYILYLRLQENIIVEATFSGVGCAISDAAASLLTDKIQGITIESAKMITEEDILTLLGIEVSLGRKNCALLLFRGLQEALRLI